MRAAACSTKLLSGPPAKVMPPVNGRRRLRGEARARAAGCARPTGSSCRARGASARGASPASASARRHAARSRASARARARATSGTHVVRLGDRAREDPARLGDAARARALDRAEDSPAAWSTFHCEQWSFAYGNASIGLRARDRAIALGVERLAAPGVRIRRRRPARSPPRARRPRGGAPSSGCLASWRSAFSITAYWRPASTKPRAISSGWTISAAGRSTRSGARAGGCAVSASGTPAARARCARWRASPPVTQHDVGALARSRGPPPRTASSGARRSRRAACARAARRARSATSRPGSA